VTAEFLKRIQEAERKAEETLKEAERKAKDRVEEAEEEARKLVREASARRKSHLAEARERGRQAAETVITQMKEANAEESLRLEKVAAKRLKKALTLIEKRIIG
jgi:vacuolar-type H+-ATPase subunit H